MNEKQKIYKREFIKKCIIAGKEHSTHYSNKILPSKTQNTTFTCICEPQCVFKFTEYQLNEIFNRYYSLKTHNEQHLFLKSLVIPCDIKNKRTKFNYFLEVKENANTV
jgi:hypothetical protein